MCHRTPSEPSKIAGRWPPRWSHQPSLKPKRWRVERDDSEWTTTATAFTPPSDPVSDLLRLPFSRRTFGEKTDLISIGRPAPKLDGLTQAGKGFVRHFTEWNDARYDWLFHTFSKAHKTAIFARGGFGGCHGWDGTFTPGWWARCTTEELSRSWFSSTSSITRRILTVKRYIVHRWHLSRLTSYDFCFFLFAFICIFDFADVLFGILQNKSLDVVQFRLARIADF